MANLNSVAVEHPFHPDYCWSGGLMTTPVNIVASHNRFLAKRASDYMATLVQQLDFFNPDSELSRLNRSAGKGQIAVSSLLYRVLRLAKILEIKTNHVFRADFEGINLSPKGNHGYTVGPYPFISLEKDAIINLGGIAKGYIVDKTFAYILNEGGQNILVDAGGDIRARSIDRPWKIGLGNPLEKQNPFGLIELFSGALVTSGTSERKLGEGASSSTHFFDTKHAAYYTNTPYVTVTVQGRFASVSEVLAKCLLTGHRVTLKKRDRALGITADYKVIIFDQTGKALKQAARLYQQPFRYS